MARVKPFTEDTPPSGSSGGNFVKARLLAKAQSSVARFVQLSSYSHQKTTNFDRNLSFFIQAAGLVWNHALACMVSP